MCCITDHHTCHVCHKGSQFNLSINIRENILGSSVPRSLPRDIGPKSLDVRFMLVQLYVENVQYYLAKTVLCNMNQGLFMAWLNSVRNISDLNIVLLYSVGETHITDRGCIPHYLLVEEHKGKKQRNCVFA